MSRSGQFIYLKTRGTLEIDETTRQVHSFVCVNSLVSDDEGRRLIREMKKKFSAIISEAELSAMESDVPAVENPQKLERAILNLITNLNNTASYDDDNISMLSDSTVEAEDTRKIKSPPLSIIPPKPNTIKTSIFKGVGVMGQKGGKSPSIKDEPKSPSTPNTAAASHPSNESPNPHTIKAETATNSNNNILSPTSLSISSVESDTTSPYSSSNNHQMLSPPTGAKADLMCNNSNGLSNDLPKSSNKLDEYLTPYDNLPVYAIETSNASTAAVNDSIMMASNSLTVNNNNESNVNRNSVLKRAFNSDDDDYTELIKKPALSVKSQAQPTPPCQSIDLLDTSVSGKNSRHLPFN
jgi:hypothetical protein